MAHPRSIAAAAAALPLLLLAIACQRRPIDRTDDLWPGFHRAAARAMPTPGEVGGACDAAAFHAEQETFRRQGHAEPVDAFFHVAEARCTAEAGSAATALCRFKGDWVPMGETEARPGWSTRNARLVHVAGEGRVLWIAPSGC